jgi:hypothetical protein
VTLTHQIDIPNDVLKSSEEVGKQNDLLLPVAKMNRVISRIDYIPGEKLIILQFTTGQTLIGRLDEGTFSIKECFIIPSLKEKKGDKSFEILQNGGSEFSNFRELSYMSKPGCLYLLANYSKQGCSVPVVLEITQDKITLDIVKPTTLSQSSKIAVHGSCLVKPSFDRKWKKAPRLLAFEENGQACVYKCEAKQVEADSKKFARFSDTQQLKNS